MTMFKTDRCLGCYRPINVGFYHESCAKALFGNSEPPELEVSYEELSIIKESMLDRRLTITGVQKKLSLGQHPTEKKRLTIVGSLGGTYILKPQSDEYPALPENEDLTMHLAEICGIKTAKHGLLPTADGKLVYVTKRFDRVKGQKIAVEDLCQLSELQTEQKYRSSHERVGKIIKAFSSIPGDDALRFYELTLFSFVTGNNDMHLKNFMLITHERSKTILSPAYDLLAIRLVIPKQDDPDELALTVNGRRNKLKLEDFYSLAESLAIHKKTADYALKKIVNNVKAMEKMIALSFLPAAMKVQFQKLIAENMNRLV